MSSLPWAELGTGSGFSCDPRFSLVPEPPAADPADPAADAWAEGHAAGLAEAQAEAAALRTEEEEVYNPDGKLRLQKRLADAINKVLVANEGFGGVDAVYFKTFLVQ